MSKRFNDLDNGIVGPLSCLQEIAGASWSGDDAVARIQAFAARELEAALAHPPAQGSDDWRPIETAPKDGRNILAWGYLHDDGGPYEIDGRSFMGEVPHEMIVYFSAEYGIWIERSAGGSYAGLTHWRPLPEPPALHPGGER